MLIFNILDLFHNFRVQRYKILFIEIESESIFPYVFSLSYKKCRP